VIPTPSWLYYLFGVLVLVVAAYGVGLLTLSLGIRRSPGRDVDVSHAFMGVSMAGMFITKWAFGPSAVWELIFSALLLWFLVRSVQSIQRWGLHLTHFLIHAVMSFAMLLMYWFPMQTTNTGASMASMSMSPSGTRLDPGLAFVLVSTLLASAIFTLASPYKGASHHGRHFPTHAMSGSSGPTIPGRTALNRPISAEALLSTPWLEDASHVVMCVAMGFMLILMI
jgi:hypothetical protein